MKSRRNRHETVSLLRHAAADGSPLIKKICMIVIGGSLSEAILGGRSPPRAEINRFDSVSNRRGGGRNRGRFRKRASKSRVVVAGSICSRDNASPGALIRRSLFAGRRLTHDHESVIGGAETTRWCTRVTCTPWLIIRS